MEGSGPIGVQSTGYVYENYRSILRGYRKAMVYRRNNVRYVRKSYLLHEDLWRCCTRVGDRWCMVRCSMKNRRPKWRCRAKTLGRRSRRRRLLASPRSSSSDWSGRRSVRAWPRQWRTAYNKRQRRCRRTWWRAIRTTLMRFYRSVALREWSAYGCGRCR